jgi:hypothetical protein
MSSSIIKSDNGVTSGVTGIVQTAGSDGTLQLQTTSSGGSATTALTINNSQQVGIGTSSPSYLLTLSGGNLGFTSGTNGIIFNNSSATTNSTLNDYETGTWTPTFSGATITGTVLYQGIYTKIGNIVTANFQVYSSSGGTIATVAGTTQITNLPFAFVGSSTVPFTSGTCINTSTSTSGGFLQGGPANKIYFCTSLAATNILSGTITYQTTF